MHLATKLPIGRPASHFAKVLPWFLQSHKRSITCLHEFFPAARATPMYNNNVSMISPADTDLPSPHLMRHLCAG